MARPSTCSPLPYIVNRQINDRLNHCKRLVNARFQESENLFRKDLLSHYGCVNAIEFSNQGDLLVSGGDDRRVLLWKVEQSIQGVGKPVVMKAQHDSNIFCLGSDSSKTKIFSAGNDDQVIVHDLKTGDPLSFFLHEKPVYGLSIHPHNDNVFSSACDDGRVLIYDIRGSSTKESFCLAQYKTAFHSVMHNPLEPRMLATANAKEGVSMWDVRKPLEPVLRYGTEGPARSCMYVRFNKAGNRLLALRRRLPPVLYATDSPTHLCQFDHPGYYNSCTMKSCCFAGNDDEYVLSGSDDFKLYMWRIPPKEIKWVDSAHMILRGHRSIVNQVRYNEASCILASSGVEKIIKIWSPFPLGNNCLGGLKRDGGKQEKQRRIFTHDEYIRLVLHSGEFMTHDYSHQSTREDPRMMAFFDSLVQREIQDWSSEDIATASQWPSDTETTSPARRTNSISDSDDDSTTSQHQLMLNILGSRANPRNSSGGVAPERPSKSPNIITRLIATHREKLMKLAAIESGVYFNNDRKKNVSVGLSASDSEAENNIRDKQHRSKCKSKLKGVKRKHNSTASGKIISSKKRRKRSRLRRKCVTLRNRNNENEEDDDSDSQVIPAVNDVTQPSTSSGLMSRRSRYTMDSTSRRSSSCSSSSSNKSSCSSGSSSSSNLDAEVHILSRKRRHIKTESDGSVNNNHRRRKIHRKCESSVNVKRKRYILDSEEENKTDSVNNEVITSDERVYRNEEASSSTPIKKSSKVPPTPDSGITSEMSTIEKCPSVASSTHNNRTCRDGSSDREQTLLNLERFRKMVDVAKRSYRMHSTQQQLSTTTDSSD